MAEFKLGRIRFVWKDAWSTATTYYKDDVIRFGGKIYICVDGHTSAAGFFTDLEIVPSKWNLVSDGQTWKGAWTVATSYVYGDIVQYGARLYIATAVHTSQALAADGLEADIANWDLFAEGLNWKGNWTVATRYIVNDLVKYGGTTYVCNTYHTSDATELNGLEADQSKWDVLNQGIEFKTTWEDGVRYKVNDVVQYGAALWITTTAHTSSTLFSTDVANWTEFVRGFQFESDWEPLRVYQPGDIVSYGGNQYIALTNHSESNPFTETTDWQLYTQGIKFLGDWGDDSTQQDYRAGEVVRHGGYTYICTADNNNQEPPNASYWERLNTGLRWRGIWADDDEYLLGDVARYGDNSYICINQHFSEGDDYSTDRLIDGGAENSRPDLDVTGTYWNIIAVGNEASVLTTKGDLVYYAGSGPARLPVGAEGQVLRVSETDTPEWAYLGVADDVYHVGTHGADVPAPTNGRTLDKPWKSIRYATEQIEKGTKNPHARKLLELNRQFIQREIVEWTDAQITGAIAPFSANMNYDSAKCERDMGFIIDAAIWDFTHGGNVRSREAALKYVQQPGQFYVLGQEGETVASINYGLTVLASVLAQTAPAANYQTLNGDNSTAVVTQYFDITLIAEATVLTEVQGLVKIVTDAITAGVATNIPARIIRNTLVKVATGKYQEVLPIIVPAECCIIGDELRSTAVAPRRASGTSASKISRNSFTYQLDGNLTPKKDAKYSLKAYDRVAAILGDIVEGISVSATTGNTETQSALYPFANIDKGHERKSVDQLARLIKRNIDHGLGDKIEAYDTLPLADTMATPANGYARNLLHANREFIKSEMIGWIADQYPTLKYSRTKCRQDTGYILDSVLYDITYGGNWQSVNAGEAYFVGAVQDSPAASERAATIASYGYLKSIMQTIARNITVTPTYGVASQVPGTAALAAQATTIGNLLDDVIDIVTNGSGSVAVTYPSVTGASAGLQSDFADIGTNAASIKTNVTSFITANFPSLVYDSAKCERDIGYILDAVKYDFCLGTNYASMIAAYSYLRRPTLKVIGDQKEATIASNEYARTLARAVTSEATAIAQVDNTMQLVNDIIWGAANEGAVAASPDFDVYSAIRQLELNKEFIASEAVAYVNDYFADTVTATTASTDVLTVTSTAWLSQNMDIKFTGTAIGGVSTSTTYYVKDIVSATTFTISTTIGGTAVSVTDGTGTMGVEMAYVYNEALCKRDVRTVVDAMKWDLTYPQEYVREYTNSITVTLPSNYKSKYCARYYINSVLGSQEEDFYYLRNGTGLRLQTMEGLYGDIGPENSTGTSRPTGGAYASLDPGWGPDDVSAWITARSPYVQNCTTFGYGAVGQKIDGALHNGGNDSMVSNDFTQVISDGIGAWLLNNGRAEMVSVFTYYSHIGYLCETGGRARATNGNNSYGDFGSVAEGVDPDETAVTAIVDNKFQYNATVGATNTDQNALLNIEFTHAGNDYTEAQINIFGAGSGEVVVADEFRDGAVIQTRVIDDQVAGDAGGTLYLVVNNTAQTGTSSSITLAATDGNLDTAYPGMKIIISGGAGIGQYALIDTYDSGTKVATVIKESDGTAGWDHFVPGTAFITPNSSSTYTIEPAISFTAPAKSATNHTITSNQYNELTYAITTDELTAVAGTSSGDGTGATFDINRMGSKYYVTLNAGGTGYTRLDTITILGTSLGGATPANDMTITLTTVTSGVVVDFDFAGLGSGGKFIAVPNNTAGRYSVDGATWSSTTFPTAGSGNWTAITSGLQNDGSSVYKPSRILAVCAGSSNVASSQNGTTWTAATALPVALNTASGQDIAFGYVSQGVNRFVVVSESDRDVAYTEDEGQNWTLTTDALPATGFTAITYGKGLYVAVQGGGSTVAASSADGITWVSRTLPSSANWVDVVWGNGRFIAIADDQTAAAYSLDGITWTALTVGLASGNPKRITYGQGMFAVTSTDTDAICYSEYGVTDWTNQAVTAATGGYNAIAFGNPNRAGKFVSIGTGTSTNVANCVLGARARGRPMIASEKIFAIKLAEPGSTYASAPTLTVTDPNNVEDVVATVRLGDGALGNPTFNNRGTGFATATAEVNSTNSNGNADFFQDGSYIAVRQLTKRPVAGSNITFASLPNQYFKLVNSITFLGTNDGSYTTFLQVSPAMNREDAPGHADPVEMRIRFSQVRLTGHDFLDIGTGNFVDTNYPGLPVNVPVQDNEALDADGGRVFFTATDQDGNFRVGDLFSIEQATGVATLNADAFNIAGLQELTLGEVTLGGNSAAVSEFSTDPFFTANSDSVVPTQRAIKAYIEAQIGGGGATLNVNSITAGDILISNNVITTASGELINITANINFTGSITGLPVAYNYFLR
jgi:hypothetical protein